MTLAQFVAEGERKWSPGEPFLVGGSTLTHGELLEQSQRVNQLLYRHLPSGGILALATTSDISTCLVLWGALRAGLPVLVLDPHTSSSELVQILGKLKVDLLLVDQDRRGDWCNSSKKTIEIAPLPAQGFFDRLFGRKQSGQESFPACLVNHPPRAEISDCADVSPALYLTTSGTTGTPHIVPVSRHTLMSQGATLTEVFQLSRGDHLLNLLPSSHYDGLVMGAWLCLWSGAILVRDRPFSVSHLTETLDLVYRHQVSHLIGVPTIWSLLIRMPEEVRRTFNSRSFRMFISTAAPLPTELWQTLESLSNRPVVNVYGLTETGNLFFAGPEDNTRAPGSVGVARGCRFRLVDSEDRDCGLGEVGELWVEGDTVFSGYVGEAPRSGEWFATGDLARIDESGLTHICGRKKDLIIVGGLNVWPAEVDTSLLKCRGVKEAATVGLADHISGEKVASVVVVEKGTSVEQVAADLMPLLTPWKRPAVLKIVEELPRGRSGKVQKDALRLLLSPVEHDPMRAPGVEEVVINLAASILKVHRGQLDLTSSPDKFASWSSLAHLDLVAGIESEFGFTMSASEFMAIHTLGDVVAIVRSHQP